MKIQRRAVLNHVGIAVVAPEPLRKLFQILGLNETSSEWVEEQAVQTYFFHAKEENQPILELLEASQDHPRGAIYEFIQKKKKGGLHHLAFEVQKGELDEVLVDLKSAGFEFIYEKPKIGAHEMRIQFIHPKSTGGVLVEIMEKGKLL